MEFLKSIRIRIRVFLCQLELGLVLLVYISTVLFSYGEDNGLIDE